mgnify:CR=1 FL=1
MLLRELTSLLKAGVTDDQLPSRLSTWNRALFESLPLSIRRQMLMPPEASSGKAQLNNIETERLLAELVQVEVEKRKQKNNSKKISFSPVCFYLGYQARSTLPSNFDCVYANALGMSAAALIESNLSGYMATVHCLTRPVQEWRCGGVPLTAMMMPTIREGIIVPVMKPASVDLNGPAFRTFSNMRQNWRLAECYRNPGPLQFGQTPLADLCTHTLTAEQGHVTEHSHEVQLMCDAIKMACRPGCTRSYLKMAFTSLKSLTDILEIQRNTEEHGSHFATQHVGAVNLPYSALASLPDQ